MPLTPPSPHWGEGGVRGRRIFVIEFLVIWYWKLFDYWNLPAYRRQGI